MADIVTSFFLSTAASRVAATQTRRLAPSALELGADRLTYNPRTEAIGRLFSRPSSNVFASIESFLAVAKAGSEQARNASPPINLKSNNKNNFTQQPIQRRDVGAQELFFQRESAAESHLKDILKGSTSPAATAAGQQPKPENTATPKEPPATAVPAITRNSGLRVKEGGSTVLNSARLSAGDKDTAKTDITFTVEDGPDHGRLERLSKPGEAVIQFTQADLETGAVRYVHDGSEANADRFTFTVSDGENEVTGSFSIGIDAVNDAPTISANTGLSLDEGASAAITTTQLSSYDPDDAGPSTVFSVTSGPASGRLEFIGSEGTSVTSFTQADLSAGRLKYVNDGGEATADSFTFTASDGAATSAQQTFSISINPVDDAPTLVANTGGTVAEGGTSTITSTQLRATDVDTTPENLTYTVTSNPTNGRIERAGSPGTAISSFTQAEVDAGLVRFVHNGSETTSDSFNFTVSDGTTTLASSTFNYSVTPVNDPPTISASTGLNVTEGGSATLTSARLNVSDPDNTPSQITYTVTSAPTQGRLERTTNPGVSITSFTQADVNSGLVRYVHSGSETTSDAFSFRVSDGNTTLSPVSFSIAVTPVDDAPTPAINTGTTVAEGGTGTITSAQLRTNDVDTSAANITYVVTNGPANGRLELTTAPGQQVNSFTQADVNANRLRYIHNGSETTSDSFTFRAADQTTILGPATFNINVTPVNDTPVVTNSGGTITEGATATITSGQLSAADSDNTPAQLTYTVTSTSNGQVERASNPGVAVTSFTQADINSGAIRFAHNGGESAAAGFGFSLSDGASTATGNFSYTVTPVNDAPTAGVNTGATVAEGSTNTITNAQLRTNDVDTAPANISYSVTSGPANGRLELSTNAGVSITSFTQEDIDANRLRYVHSGSETTSDSFTFTASDGQYALPSSTFNINVTPVNDTPVLATNTGGTVQEGGNAAITSAQLNTTDADNTAAQLTYTVTSTTNGSVQRSGVNVSSFTQADINAGTIRFVHNGSETATGGFGFTVSDGAASTSANFNFAVTPVNDAPTAGANTGATVAEDSTSTITNTQLRTNDTDTAAANITYGVNVGPTHGRLELSTNAGVAITSFTQADIDANRLRYVHNGSEAASDSFTFTASDGQYSLPSSTFNINVTPVNDTPVIAASSGTITEGATSTITSAQLNATDADNTAAELTYAISGVTGGRVERASNPGVAITSFTQADINTNSIRFVHNGGESPTAGFAFTVSDGAASTAGNFNYSVTALNDPPVLATNSAATVARTRSVILTSANLNTTDVDTTSANIRYNITTAPTRGRLELTTNPGVSITSFTQADIDAGRVRYVHTRTTGIDDTFRFRVTDGTTQLANTTFNIIVT